ncbi:LysR substrate-binding domain-containing protein [Paracoccus sp. SMMA_5_TC]|uniref:LysR substrate-binding domain-containing protein n=2 Tax=unclassified Paracoccus (in: a-proteobacteria) TaxID=2688777 RepID=UPI0012B2D61B|nr:LysR substrate-binding domain-containing protein [Paracoccus sp. SMMA_5_TC]UXU80689.1 LysR substrate-binding domain-containing protein [Paracoccus sp. SMMA_5_TC]
MPSMTALRVLLALSERGSTTAAAESLHMSQSAVSKQLLTLEGILGAKVFHRQQTGLMPSELGKIYIEQARIAVKAMEDAAFRAARLQADPHRLRLKVLPIFGDRWLLPRIADFNQRYPEIEIQHTTFSATHSPEQPDATFHFGPDPLPGTDTLRMFGQDVFLVCAPAYLERLEGAETIEDFARGTFFEHPGTPLHWAHLAEWHGRPDLQPRNIVRFEYYTLVLRAIILGQGLALVPPQLIENELASGQLVNAGGLSYKSPCSYWFSVPSDRKPSAALVIFRKWLLTQL